MTSPLHRVGTFPAALRRRAVARTAAEETPRNDQPRPQAGARKLGAWNLSWKLGEGRWGQVHAAARLTDETSPPLGNDAVQWDYAVKWLRGGLNDHQRALGAAMLRREIQVGAQVSNANLAPALDWQLEGEPFLVMPRLEGASVRTLLAQRRHEHGCLIGAAKGLVKTVWIARQVASALAALHAAGWLHGDVKPENVLLSPQGHATLIDVGLARKLDSPECRAGEVLAGALAYVSPESFLPTAMLTAESDIYSLGVMLHELLTGQGLFEGLGPTELALAHLRASPPDVREAALDVPPELSRLVMRMLAKDPLRRPAAGDVVRQLTRMEIGLLGR